MCQSNMGELHIPSTYLLNSEIHAPIFSSAQLALSAASVAPLKIK